MLIWLQTFILARSTLSLFTRAQSARYICGTVRADPAFVGAAYVPNFRCVFNVAVSNEMWHQYPTFWGCRSHLETTPCRYSRLRAEIYVFVNAFPCHSKPSCRKSILGACVILAKKYDRRDANTFPLSQRRTVESADSRPLPC